MTNPPPTSKPPLVGPHGLMPVLTDWWAELNWPRIIASARTGLRPGRLGLAFFAIVAAFLLISIGLAVDKAVGRGNVESITWPWSYTTEPREQLIHLWRFAVTLPKHLLIGIPFTTVVIGPILLSVWLVMLAAISRITACELTQGLHATWTEGLSFAVPRWRSLLGAIVGPLALVWLIAAALILGAWVFMHVPYLNLIGGLLYPVFLLGGLVATIILVGYLLGHNLFIPAITCEGADAIDAVQRGYTYFLAKPIRLLFYTLCGGVGIAVTVGIIAYIILWSIGFAAESAGVWSGLDGKNMVWHGTFEALSVFPCFRGSVSSDTPMKTWAAGSWLIRFWTTVPIIFIFAAFISCGISACTALYLAMRRVCDGQDWAELWTPGMIAGTMAQALSGRARIAADMGLQRQPLPEEADDE